MSDDSFIREVEEELRSDRMQSIWKRFGPLIIGLAVLIVLAVTINTAWNAYTDSQATASGDRFRNALELIDNEKTDEARAALEALQADGYGQYPVLARMRIAGLEDDPIKAVEEFDAIAADNSVPVVLRDTARMRAAYLMIDNGSYADVASRAEILSADTNPMRHAAREALGLAAWKENRLADAKALFEQISEDQAAPPPTRQRAVVMLDLIRASGEVAEE